MFLTGKLCNGFMHMWIKLAPHRFNRLATVLAQHGGQLAKHHSDTVAQGRRVGGVLIGSLHSAIQIVDDFNQIALTVDGRTLQFTTFITGEKGIAWSLNEATEAKVVVSIRGNPQPLQRTGPWSLFQLFGEARNWKPAGGNKYQAAWTFTHENRQVQVPFELNFPYGAPILNPDWLRGLSCVSTISY